MATKTKKAPAPVVEDDDEVELEELDTDVEEDDKPAKKSKGGQEEVAFGVRQLIDLIKAKTGKDYTPREVRTLLRKMARDGSGRIQREIKADNRSRYSWTGPDDPEVKKVLKAVSGGEIEQGKQEALAKLKEQKAAKAAAKEAAPAKKGKKAPKVVEPDDDDDIDELDDDDDE